MTNSSINSNSSDTPKTAARAAVAPKYFIGDVVAGSYYAGVIINAFFSEGKWNYGVGKNASTELTELDKKTGYLIGPKFIAEDDIKWHKSAHEDLWRSV